MQINILSDLSVMMERVYSSMGFFNDKIPLM